MNTTPILVYEQEFDRATNRDEIIETDMFKEKVEKSKWIDHKKGDQKIGKDEIDRWQESMRNINEENIPKDGLHVIRYIRNAENLIPSLAAFCKTALIKKFFACSSCSASLIFRKVAKVCWHANLRKGLLRNAAASFASNWSFKALLTGKLLKYSLSFTVFCKCKRW